MTKSFWIVYLGIMVGLKVNQQKLQMIDDLTLIARRSSLDNTFRYVRSNKTLLAFVISKEISFLDLTDLNNGQ